MALQTLNTETIMGIGVPDNQTGTLTLVLEISRQDIIGHAARKGDANEIHFRERRWGFIIQESLIASKAIDPIKEALRRRIGRNPILDEIEKVKFPAPAYSNKPVHITVEFEYSISKERIAISFCGRQRFAKRETVCFQGRAIFYNARIRKKA